MLEITEMKKEDLSEVAGLERQIFSQPWTERGFFNALEQKNTCYLIARENGKLAGYCGFLQVLEEADITNVAVAEELRGNQIGYCILEQLLECAKKRGVTAVTLEVRVSNEPARNLYRKLGFEEAGIRKRFYDFPEEDAVIMWRR